MGQCERRRDNVYVCVYMCMHTSDNVYVCVYIHLIMCLYPLVADKLRYTRFPDFPPQQM